MQALTKEQVKKLTREQQDTLATIELRLLKKRQRLLDVAHGKRRWTFIVGGTLAMLYLLYLASVYRETSGSAGLLVSGPIIITWLAAVYLDQRLDALIELLERDTNPSDQKSKNSDVG